ncbi:hypothetical protein EDD21DRAFT_360176 [Dissophora ornata]|nr:hypothetical protein BGZ58_003289 [Dissophora ornata]KAI8606783.1 hypothetical protein EDD21DRAFT_360176 [Dissophora ornata]
MELPELRSHVAQYLDPCQLARAAQVSKGWNETFTPVLYADIEWSRVGSNPSVETIIANADHIRNLRLYKEPTDFPLEICTRLERLYLEFLARDPTIWDRLSSLVLQNPKLAELETMFMKVPSEFIGAILDCPYLRKLQASFFESFDRRSTEFLLDTCVRLRTLDLTEGALGTLESLDRWPQFPALEKLFLDIEAWTVFRQTELMRRCPRLKSLRWSVKDTVFPTADICQLCSTICPLLEELEFWDVVLSDKDVSRVLDSCATRLALFSISESSFGPFAMQSLGRHFSTLTQLDIRRCLETTSAMAHQILLSCPRLTWFCADRLEARDILGVVVDVDETSGKETVRFYPQDWVCRDLRFLTIFICGLEDRPVEWQRMVLRQLAKMDKLDFLTIAPYEFNMDGTRDGIDLRLEAGLDILSSLKLLDRFCFDGLWQEMEEEDVRWMVEAWPRLEAVEGKVHRVKNRRLELQKILKERDIRMVIYFDDEEEGRLEEEREDEDVDGISVAPIV